MNKVFLSPIGLPPTLNRYFAGHRDPKTATHGIPFLSTLRFLFDHKLFELNAGSHPARRLSPCPSNRNPRHTDRFYTDDEISDRAIVCFSNAARFWLQHLSGSDGVREQNFSFNHRPPHLYPLPDGERGRIRGKVRGDHFHVLTSTKWPAIAAAAAISGLTRCVRPPLPCRPSKLRLEVEAERSPDFN